MASEGAKATMRMALRALHRELVYRYPSGETARRIAEQAGVNVALVDFGGPPANRWWAILREAAFTRRLGDLMEVARGEHVDVAGETVIAIVGAGARNVAVGRDIVQIIGELSNGGTG